MAIKELMPGMLLLDYGPSIGTRPMIWTVKSKRTLIAYGPDGITIQGTLTRKGKGIPNGMVLLDGPKLAADLKTGESYAIPD